MIEGQASDSLLPRVFSFPDWKASREDSVEWVNVKTATILWV